MASKHEARQDYNYKVLLASMDNNHLDIHLKVKADIEVSISFFVALSYILLPTAPPPLTHLNSSSQE